MKVLLFLMLLIPVLVHAEDRDLYYYGVAQLTDLKDGTVSNEKLLLAKSMLSSKEMIVEIACTKAENQSAVISPVFMKLENRSLSIFDSQDMVSKKLSGVGEVQGESWNWNYLYFSMVFETEFGKVRIEDWNFVAGKKLIARKQVFFKDNPTPFQLWDVDSTEISKSEHDKMFKEMGCPSL